MKSKMPKLKRSIVLDVTSYNNYDLYMLKEEIEQCILQRKAKAKELLTVTILGQHINVNAAKTNKLMAHMGLQVRVDLKKLPAFWMPTNKGMPFCEVFKVNDIRIPSPDMRIDRTAPYPEIVQNLEFYQQQDWSDVTWTVYSSYFVKWKETVIPLLKDFVDKNPDWFTEIKDNV